MCVSKCVNFTPATRASRSVPASRAPCRELVPAYLPLRPLVACSRLCRSGSIRATKRNWPPAYDVHSLLSAKWIPRSHSGWSRAKRAASGNQGHGTRTLAEVIHLLLRASMVALLTECSMPKSSAWITSNREVAGYPSRSATVFGVRPLEALGCSCDACASAVANITVTISLPAVSSIPPGVFHDTWTEMTACRLARLISDV